MSEIIQHWLERIGQTHSLTAEIIAVCAIGFGLLLCALSSLFLARRVVSEDESEALWTRAAEEGDARAIGFHAGLNTGRGQQDHVR